MTKPLRLSILSSLVPVLALGFAIGCSQNTGDRVVSPSSPLSADAPVEEPAEAAAEESPEASTEDEAVAQDPAESAELEALSIAPHLGDKPITQPDLAIGSQQTASIPETAPPRQTCDAQTQTALNQCAEANYAKADEYLNQVYQGLKSSLSQTGQAKLIEAEQAWLSFRDTSCGFERSQFEDGSIAPLVYYSCMEALTDQRSAELKQLQLPQSAYVQADQRLNQVYRSLKSSLGTSAQTQLTESQLAWLKYRDQNCVFEELHAEAVISETQCLARMTETRTEQLQDTLEQRQL